jgi:hypothetical protein
LHSYLPKHASLQKPNSVGKIPEAGRRNCDRNFWFESRIFHISRLPELEATVPSLVSFLVSSTVLILSTVYGTDHAWRGVVVVVVRTCAKRFEYTTLY